MTLARGRRARRTELSLRLSRSDEAGAAIVPCERGETTGLYSDRAGGVKNFFGVGALAAALAAVVGFGLPVQFLVFCAVSVALTLASRTIFSRYFVRAEDEGGSLKTGVDALPEKEGETDWKKEAVV